MTQARQRSGRVPEKDLTELRSALNLYVKFDGAASHDFDQHLRAAQISRVGAKRFRFFVKLAKQVGEGKFDDVIHDTTFDVEALSAPAVVASKVESAEASAVGPVVTARVLAEWKEVSKTALTDAQKQRKLLGFKAGRIWLYPVFQLNEYGDYLPNLARVLSVLDPNRIDDGSSAVWLNQPLLALDGRTAAEALRDEDTDLVVRAASDVAYGWAS